MRQDFSRTAEGVALVRALEQFQPAERRILYDPWSREFLQNRWYLRIIRSAWRSRGILKFLQYWAPGGQEFLTMRPQLVDELAAAQAAQGVKQLVMLGAGFDTLAWRQQAALADVAVYELDHPATQVAKREISTRIGTPANVRFVAVDFETDDFAEKLQAAGFDAAQPSFIVWVGVSMYLTAEAVTQTMQRISALMTTGSLLVLDYLLADVVAGTSANREALAKGRRAAQLGEPWLFGLAVPEVRAFVASFGFDLQKDYEPAELQARYAPKRQRPMDYVRIAVCERK